MHEDCSRPSAPVVRIISPPANHIDDLYRKKGEDVIRSATLQAGYLLGNGLGAVAVIPFNFPIHVMGGYNGEMLPCVLLV